MKKISQILLTTLFFFLILPVFVFSQADQSAKWIRVQSDNGEFSIELPASAGLVFDKTGFRINGKDNSHKLTDVYIFNSYQDGSLLAVDAYKTSNSKDVVKALIEMEAKNSVYSEINRGSFQIRQIFNKDDKHYYIRQLITSKNYVYILTAISRTGETASIKHFLDSLTFKPVSSSSAAQPTDDKSVLLFSKIKPYTVEFATSSPPKNNQKTQIAMPPPEDPAVLPFAIFTKPRASYTDPAREAGEQGILRLQVTFAGNGRITKINAFNSLGYGLLREALFAALQIKFLPEEKTGIPQTVTKVIEYSFSIY